jgi:hypothetical protein
LLNDNIPNYEWISDRQIYLLHKSIKQEMSQGFLPIQFFIYDIMRLKMHNMYNDLKSNGATIYGMNTDSLFINKDFKFKDSKRDNNTFESIGKTRYEANKECIYKFYEFKQMKIKFSY